MTDITELAVASWRLEKWLDRVNVERKMAAKSALRTIKKYLHEKEIEVEDLTGERFDVGLAVTVVNNESEEAEEDKLLISEMVRPIVKEKGAVIQYGQVVLNEKIKEEKTDPASERQAASAPTTVRHSSRANHGLCGHKRIKLLLQIAVLVSQAITTGFLVQTLLNLRMKKR